jgi:hypothetical protein
MANKKPHMTKYEYEARHTKYRYAHSLDVEGEENRSVKSMYAKDREKSDMEMKKRLRSIQRFSDDVLEDE